MSRRDGERAGDRFKVNAQAKGHGDVRVVVQGTQQNVQNHFYGDAAGPLRPFDLPNLRLWIDRIVADCRQQATAEARKSARKEAAGQLLQLTALQQSVSDPRGNADGKNALRRLLASGVAQYLSRAGQLPAGRVPDQLLLDLMVFALWPVLQAPSLPATWHQDLAELTSPRVAVLTAAARDLKAADRLPEVEAFASTLSAKPVKSALVSLLDDLNDPGRGGFALTALAAAAGLPRPPRRGGAKATATWMLAILAGGAAGAAADAIEGEVGRLLAGAHQSPGHFGSHQGTAPAHHHGHTPGHGHGGGNLLDDISHFF